MSILMKPARTHNLPQRPRRQRRRAEEVTVDPPRAEQAMEALHGPQRGVEQRQAALRALQRHVGNAGVERMLAQRDAGKATSAANLTEKQADAAVAWAATEKLGVEAVRALQQALGLTPNGVYDRATAEGVYQKQREWQKKGRIAKPGKADEAVFGRLGLIRTRTITAATVTDDVLAAVKRDFPTGVTVAIYAKYDYGSAATRKNNAEFLNAAEKFASANAVVGLSGGAATRGQPVPVKDVGQVIEVVQSIHRGLAEQHRRSLPPEKQAEPLPAHTRVKNLALFAHGEPYGMSLDEKNRFSLRSEASDLRAANVHAFVQGLSGAVASDVNVQLFACSTARDPARKKESYDDWQEHVQGKRRGKGSFAAQLAKELGPDASVFGHTTAGHTTENFAATAFGKVSGGEGLHMFDLMYPEAFIAAELARLYPDLDEPTRAGLHDKLRDEMWRHYQDSIVGEAKGRNVPDPKDPKKKKLDRTKRYAAGTPPLGQEMFLNPDHARALFQANWQSVWMTEAKRAQLVPKPKKAKAPKKTKPAKPTP
jgi:hypothetical protein